MKLLLLGASGMLGHDVARVAREEGYDLLALGHSELDVTDGPAVERAVSAARPSAVVNCAAYTNVDGAEAEEGLAHAVNGVGAGHVATAASRAGARVVHVSSDYVFDGDKGEPYVEHDRTGPRSAYGRSKLDGERRTAAGCHQHVIVRSSWLFGAHGHNFVATMLRLAGEREEVRVVDDQVGCPTYTGHLAGALVELAGSEAYGIHHVAGTGACSWFELARETFARAGVGTRVTPCTTAEMPRPAPRPRLSALEATRPETPRLPGWRDGLAAYLAEREVHAA